MPDAFDLRGELRSITIMRCSSTRTMDMVARTGIMTTATAMGMEGDDEGVGTGMDPPGPSARGAGDVKLMVSAMRTRTMRILWTRNRNVEHGDGAVERVLKDNMGQHHSVSVLNRPR